MKKDGFHRKRSKCSGYIPEDPDINNENSGFRNMKIFKLTSQGNIMDLFPRTDKSCGLIPLHGKSEKHRPDIKTSLSFHVETVVLMSRVGK